MAALPVNNVITLHRKLIMNFCNIAIFAMFLQVSLISAKVEQPIYQELYNAALLAYAEENWFACASHMDRAIFEYHAHKVTVAHCLQACQYDTGEKIDATEFVDLAFFSTIIAKSACIQRCKLDKSKALKLNIDKEESESIRLQFESLECYNYLQICAYKADNLEMAASAAYTFLMAHPDDKDMTQNVIFYRSLPDMKMTYFRDLESLPHQDAYREGLLAYADEDWFTTTEKLEKATRLYFEAFDRCKALCEDYNSGTVKSTNFNMYIAVHLVSLLKCKQQCVRKLSTMAGRLIPDYLAEHYNHLQYAFYKLNDMKKAVASVATYLLLKANDEMMLENKKFYMTEPGIQESDFQPDEDALLYVKRSLIEARLLSVAESKLNLSIGGMSENKRKAKKGDTGDGSVNDNGAGHYIDDDEDDEDDDDAKDLDGDEDEDISDKPVSDNGDADDDDIFGIRKDDLDDTCPFNDGDDEDDVNDDSIENEDGVSDDDRTNPDDDADPVDETKHDAESGSNPLPLDTSLFGPRDAKFLAALSSHHSSQGIQVAAQAVALQGTHRVAADGLLTQTDCDRLITVARKGVVQGDGYNGYGQFISPHTNYEKFEGLTVGRATQLTLDGTISADDTDLLLSASEKGRTFLEQYYNLQRPLYYHFTHLVCRTALPGDDEDRRQVLSHPVHSDNCIIQSDGSCLKQKPAYVSRHLTGLIYLNEDFEGGEFFWAYKNQSIQKTLSPKCGRFVGFESSDYHGVKAVVKGQRCAVAMWYTFDAEEQEVAHEEARSVVHDLKKDSSGRQVASPELKSLLSDKGYTLSETEDDLGGPERFVADGITTREESDTLIKLATEMGVASDGYSNKSDYGHTSPHTEHEIFTGLSMLRVAKLATKLQVSAEAIRLYLDVSERARHLVATYFNLRTPLYFTFTHLVCRRALNDSNVDRIDLSHPIHSDNCLLQSDGSCLKERPAYIERDYSAIVYLNNNFSGGEFFFTDNQKREQSRVKPQSGRVVGFRASAYHGVRAVLSGERCAVALWFTLDWRYREKAHDMAKMAVASTTASAMGPSVPTDHGGEL